MFRNRAADGLPRRSAAASRAAPPVEACAVFHLDPVKVAALRARVLGDASVTALAETFKVLGDTTRVRILDALSRSELCVCDIARLLGLSESAVSHQLRLLRGMRLVRPRRDGRMVFYRARRPAHRRSLRAGPRTRRGAIALGPARESRK